MEKNRENDVDMLLTPDIVESLQNHKPIVVEPDEKAFILSCWKRRILYNSFVTLPILLVCILFLFDTMFREEDGIKVVIILPVWLVFCVGFVDTVRKILQQMYWRKISMYEKWEKQIIYIVKWKRGKLYGAYIKDGRLYQGEIIFHYNDYTPGFYKALIHMDAAKQPVLLIKWQVSYEDFSDMLEARRIMGGVFKD